MYRSLKDTAPASFLYRASSEIEIPRVSFKNVNFVTPIHQDYLNKISKDNYSGFVWAGSISLLYIAHHHAWILLYPLSTCFPFTGTRREEREECQPCKSCEESRLEEEEEDRYSSVEQQQLFRQKEPKYDESSSKVEHGQQAC